MFKGGPVYFMPDYLRPVYAKSTIAVNPGTGKSYVTRDISDLVRDYKYGARSFTKENDAIDSLNIPYSAKQSAKKNVKASDIYGIGFVEYRFSAEGADFLSFLSKHGTKTGDVDKVSTGEFGNRIVAGITPLNKPIYLLFNTETIERDLEYLTKRMPAISREEALKEIYRHELAHLYTPRSVLKKDEPQVEMYDELLLLQYHLGELKRPGRRKKLSEGQLALEKIGRYLAWKAAEAAKEGKEFTTEMGERELKNIYNEYLYDLTDEELTMVVGKEYAEKFRGRRYSKERDSEESWDEMNEEMMEESELEEMVETE